MTGATGSVGRVVLRRLVNDGWQVRALVRRRPAGAPEIAGATVIEGDLGDRAALERLIDGVEVIHHLAGRAHGGTRTTDAEYEEANARGTANIAEAARVNPECRVVLYSTISVYGPTDGLPPVDERATPDPVGGYARSKLSAERALRDAIGQRATVLRLAAVYGPYMKGNYLRLVRVISAGRYVPVGPGLNRRTLVFVEDVAQAAALVSDASSAGGETLNVTDGQVHTLGEITATMHRALGRRPRPLHVPLPLATAIARAWDVAAMAPLVPRGGTELLSKYLEDSAVRGDRLRDLLGYRPAYGLLEGWSLSIAALRAEHAL